MAKAACYLLLLVLALLGLAGCSSTPAGDSKGELKFTMRAFERAIQGCGDTEKSPHPCVTYRVTWPVVTSGGSSEAAQRMNQAILDALQPRPPSADWAQEASVLESDYASFQESKFDNEVIFYHRRVAEVIRISDAIISISVTEDRFAGDEPPKFNQNFINLHPRTGEILRLSGLLAPGAAGRLRHYQADAHSTPFAPAPEGLFLANEPGLPPILIPWTEAASLFPPGSPIVPPPGGYTKR
ncbi:MAG: hypothetical protein KJZ84_14050 [Bryobacteraceae bacterium]|nr:hypothetical protein [Bryobacteraceae bacterium]